MLMKIPEVLTVTSENHFAPHSEWPFLRVQPSPTLPPISAGISRWLPRRISSIS